MVFSVIDVIAILTNQIDYKKARKYWNKLKERLNKEWSEVVTKCHQLKLPTQDGKMRKTNGLNTEGIFKTYTAYPIIKGWLVKISYERI